MIEQPAYPLTPPSDSDESGTRISALKVKLSTQQRLSTASSMSEARGIILEEQKTKLASLVTVEADPIDIHQPLVDLGLDSLIAIDFKDWLKRSLGADLRGPDILESSGLESLSDLVARKSKFVSDSLPESGSMEKEEDVTQSDAVPFST